MKLVFVQRECEYRFAKSPGAMLMPHLSLTQSNRPTQSHYRLLLKWELLQLLKGDEELRSMLRKQTVDWQIQILQCIYLAKKVGIQIAPMKTLTESIIASTTMVHGVG